MKKLLLALVTLASASLVSGQINSVQMGSAGNVYTVLLPNVNSLAANEDVNSVVLVHRNNPNVNGGSTAEYRYDVSTNGGTAFTINQGVLNPNADVTLNAGRYPNGVIHNPSGNSTATNAYLGYYGATVDLNTTNWNGHISGVAKLDNNPATFTETINTPLSGEALIPKSLTNGSNGVFWAVDNGLDNNNQVTGEVVVMKGLWNSSTNDIDWNVDTIFDPTYETAIAAAPQIPGSSINIAFDPTGMVGWVAYNTDMTLDGDAIFNPTFYYTDDGGANWNGPIISALHQNPSLEAFVGANGTTESVTSTFDADLVVDINGVPHYLTALGAALKTAYNVFNPNATYNLGLYDITVDTGSTGSCQVQAQLIRQLETFRGTYGAAVTDNRPQTSRTEDGSKIFFGWSDSPTNAAAANATPDFFGRAIDVVNGTMTQVKNFTNGDLVWEQTADFAMCAEETFTSGTTYTVPTIFTELTATDLDPVNFHYIQNIEWDDADFVFNLPVFTTSIYEANNPICYGGSTGSIAVLGFEGNEGSPLNTGSFNGTNASGAMTTGLTFTPQTDITITGLNVPTSAGTDPVSIQVVQYTSANPGTGALFTTLYYDTNVVGTGTIPVFIPAEAGKAIGVFGGRGNSTSLTMADGGNSGLNANVGGITSNVQRLVFNGNLAAAEATPVDVSVSGSGAVAQLDVEFVISNLTYVWDDPSAQTTPQAVGLDSGSYNVSVTNSQGCTQVLNATLNYPPEIFVGFTSTDVFCHGDSTGSIDINPTGGFGQFTYNWNTGSQQEDLNNLPTGTYVVDITDSIGCTITQTYTLNEPDSLFIPLWDITELTCNGNESGAVSVTPQGGVMPYTYTWNPGGPGTNSITNIASGTYNVIVSDANGCTFSNDYFVPEPEEISIVVNTTGDYNGNAGTMFAVVTGDFPPFTYLWDNNPPSNTPAVFNVPFGTYNVTITDANGCTNTAEAIVDDVTSVGAPNELPTGLSIFPNPASRSVNLQFNLQEEHNITVQLLDLSGRVVKQQQLGDVRERTATLELDAVPAGAYLIQAQSASKAWTHRLLVIDGE